MRSDKDGISLSEKDVQTSNATLNTLFGGARKKAWMTGAGAPVRPSPRPSISRPAGPQVSSERIITTVLPARTPRNAYSPVISSTPSNNPSVGDGNHHSVLGEENRRRSITASSTRHRITSPVDTNDNIDNIDARVTPVHSPIIPSKRPHSQPYRPISPIETVEEVPPIFESPTISTSPGPARSDDTDSFLGPATSVAAASIRGIDNSPQPHQNLERGTAAEFREQIPVTTSESTTSIPLPAHNARWPRPPQATAGENITTTTNGFSPAVSPAPFSSRLSSASSGQESLSHSGFRPNMSGILPQPHKRQRIHLAAMPSLRPRAALIETHIASCGGIESLNHDLDAPRFQLLERACINEDSFYVALHQLFCIWDVESKQITHIPGFPAVDILQIAFQNVSQLIRDNSHLTLKHKLWFTKFPSPLSDLLRTSELYRKTVTDVGIFLRKLATDWVPLSMECSSRKYPPLVDEIVQRLGLLSPILQGVVFTAARRNIDITEGQVADMMEAVFRQDQKEHQALAARYNTPRPPSLKEIQDRNKKLVNEYLRIYGQFMEQRLASSPALSTSVTPATSSNDQFQTQTQPHPQHQQQQLFGSPTMSNLPNNHNWQQFSRPQNQQNQQFQQPQQQQRRPSMQQYSVGPSNVNMSDRRTQGISPQQAYLPNSSPLLPQGLVANSPTPESYQLRSNNPPMQQQRQNSSSYYPSGPSNITFQQSTTVPLHATSVTPQQYQQWVLSQHTTQVQRQQQQQQFAMLQMQRQQNQPSQINPQNMMQQQALNQDQLPNDRVSRRSSNASPMGDQRQLHSRTSSISNGGNQIQTIAPGFGPLRQNSGPVYRTDPQLSLNQHLPSEIVKYMALPVDQRPFVPPLGYVTQQQGVAPGQSALHQAHVRSPRLVPVDVSPLKDAEDNSNQKYYQAVKAFAFKPTKINNSAPMSTFEFNVSTLDFDLIPKDFSEEPGQVATRKFRHGTLQYRLRCVQMNKTVHQLSASDWVVSDTTWPENASIDINSKHLEIRRKLHHGKDLPLDITSYVLAAGPDTMNRINISIALGRAKMMSHSYFIAVEVIEILERVAIVELVKQNHILADHTLENIKKTLTGPNGGDDDDDFAMVVSDLAIDLADPFTARIFEIPVRGTHCLHRECFDLNNFLLTRPSKPKRPEQPCMIDVWKCPLCSKDARPYGLQIDDFLVSVRTSLASQDLLDVKAIWIGPDGNWRPKLEERTGVSDPHDSDDSSDGEGEKKQRSSREPNQISRTGKVIEVIELDDD